MELRTLLAVLLMSVLQLQVLAQEPEFRRGADLSYVNEMEDCGAVYRNAGEPADPFVLFRSRGCDLVRVRLWHHPQQGTYSNFGDVQKTIRRARQQGMEVLLDFHYSDTWADPHRQDIPEAWASVTDLNVLGDSLYNYTLNTLLALGRLGLTPGWVQTGNEINTEILQPAGTLKDRIDWERERFLLNTAVKAVRDASDSLHARIQVMIHIAQPENAEWWFREADENHFTDFDLIGLSYYPLWSTVKPDSLPSSINKLVTRYGKPVMIVETAYPYTMDNVDPAGNILGENSLVAGYPATPDGQKRYLTDLVKLIRKGGGCGLIYWEPAWVSTSCRTQWGQGSHWDNATLFDCLHGNEPLPGFDFFTSSTE
jgi:arabinogalactan endo-1,4-beta-galactosidase